MVLEHIDCVTHHLYAHFKPIGVGREGMYWKKPLELAHTRHD